MNAIVPATTRVRRSRAHNIDTDRLMRRHDHLDAIAGGGFVDCGQRRDFVNLALEMRAIEDVLDARGVTFTRRTLTADVCRRLSTHNP